MLRYRLLAGSAITALLVAALSWDARRAGSLGLSLFLAFGATMVLREFYRMVRAKGARPFAWFGIFMGALLVATHDRWCWEKWHGAERLLPDLMNSALAVGVLGVCILQGLRKRPDGAILDMSATLMGLVYVWFLPGFLLKIRHLGLPGGTGWAQDGAFLVLLSIFAAKMSDVGGYFIGRSFGKHKLSPVISPKKTWEGAAGGLAASLALVALCKAFAPLPLFDSLSWPLWLLFGAAMAVTSLLGDLLASSLKRDSQIKDSGTSVPGYGGLLDVVDSLMVSSPVAYFFFVAVGAQPAWTPAA